MQFVQRLLFSQYDDFYFILLSCYQHDYPDKVKIKASPSFWADFLKAGSDVLMCWREFDLLLLSE